MATSAMRLDESIKAKTPMTPDAAKANYVSLDSRLTSWQKHIDVGHFISGPLHKSAISSVRRSTAARSALPSLKWGTRFSGMFIGFVLLHQA